MGEEKEIRMNFNVHPLASSVILLAVYFGFIFDEVYGLQEFYRQPENATATQGSGSAVFLRCIIKNKGKGAVQWTKGGFGLGIEKSLPHWPRYSMIGPSPQTLGDVKIEEFSLKIVQLSLSDDDYYQCQVMATEDSQSLVSNFAYVNVLVPPSQPILKKGITIPVELNVPTNVTCEALNGKPKAQITWKKDGIRITENTYELVAMQPDGKRVDTTGIVTITAQQSDAGKRLECGAWNEALGDEEPYWTQATLDVTYKPRVRLTHNNPDRTMREHDNVKFTCTGEANPYLITWKWSRNGDAIKEDDQDFVIKGNTLTAPDISYEFHGDVITCEAENTVGSTTVDHRLNILYGPKFKGEPSHVSVDIGDRAELKCEAEGNPTAEISWRKSEQFHKLHVSSTYVIPHVRKEHFGVYVCTATVLGFSEVSKDVYLTENGPPKIMSDAVQYATAKSDGHLQCMTISSPKPDSIKWTRGGSRIDYAGRFSTQEEELPYGRKSILQILNIQDEDFGEYNCSVTNSRGKTNIIIKLTEKEEIPIAVIAGASAGGVLVIVVIVLACVVYHRCKHSDNESYAETDSNTEIKKRDKNESPSEMTKSTLMDQWRQDYNYRYSADFDEADSKPSNNGLYGSFVAEPYGNLSNTLPARATQNIYTEEPSFGDDTRSINRFENSYSTGYIPSTFRSPSRTDFNASGYVSTLPADFSGRVSTTDFSGRVSTEPRLPPADYSTSKLATNV